MGDIFDEIAGNVDVSASPSVSPTSFQGDIFDQIAASVSVPQEQPSLIQSLWSDIKGTPAAALEMVKSIPTGISNLAHLPGDLAYFGTEAAKMGYSDLTGEPYIPGGTFEDFQTKEKRAESTLKGTAGLATALASAGVTGAAAPVGISAGNKGLDWLLQAVGAAPESTPQQDVADLRTGTVQNALLIGAGKALGAAGGKVLGPAEEVANAMDRKSLGARQSDYGKVSDTRTVESPSGVTETFVKSALDDLLENNKLGLSRDPAKLSKIVEEKSLDLASKIDDVITKFDESGVAPAEPYFGGSVEYLKSGKVPANLVPSYIERLKALDDAIRTEGEGSLSYLQQQKVAFGKSYDPADKVLSGFNRSIYNDLKTSIEQYAPEIKPLNKELAKYIVTEPIVNRALKASENKSVATQLADLGWTTTGIGAPTIAGSVIGGAPGAAIGATIGLAGKALKSPTGQSTLARLLRVVSKGDLSEITAAANTMNDSKPITDIYTGPNAEKNSQLKQSLNNVLGDTIVNKEEIKAIDNGAFEKKVNSIADDLEVDPSHLLAVMNFETGGTLSPSEKNRAGSGATGLIQFMPATAKEVTGEKTGEAAIKALSKMTATEQLDYVKKYLEPFKGKLNSLEDVYMAVLYPKAIGKDSEYALFKEGTKAYWQNRGLDLDENGIITKAEASKKVEDYSV